MKTNHKKIIYTVLLMVLSVGLSVANANISTLVGSVAFAFFFGGKIANLWGEDWL